MTYNRSRVSDETKKKGRIKKGFTKGTLKSEDRFSCEDQFTVQLRARRATAQKDLREMEAECQIERNVKVPSGLSLGAFTIMV